MAAKGFKIADGYVEIRAEINESQIRNAARRVGREFGTSGGGEGGRTFSSAMAASIVRNMEKDFDIKVVRSRLIPGLGSTIQQSLRKSIADGAEESGRGFFDRFARGLLTPNPRILSALRTGVPAVLSSPLGVGALTLGGMFAVSFATAFISSGALGLIGAGLLGLGGFAVSASTQIQRSFQRTGERIKEAFFQTGGALIPPFVAAGEQIGDYFESRFAPRLRVIFQGLSPVVEPIVTNVIEAVDRFVASLQPHVGDLASVLEQMFNMLPSISSAVSDFFSKLLANRGEIAEGFENVVRVLNGLLRFSADFLVTGTRIFNWLSDLDKWLRSSFLWKVLSEEVGGLFEVIEHVGKGIDLIFPDPINANVSNLAQNLRTFASTGRIAGEAARVLGGDLKNLELAIATMGPEGFAGEFPRFIKGFAEFLVPPIGAMEGSLSRSKQQIEAFDNALAELVFSGNTKAAQQAFERIAEVAARSSIGVDRLKELFPVYTEAIRNAIPPVDELRLKTGNWADALQGTIDTTTATGIAFEAFRRRTDLMSSSMAEAIVEANGLKGALDILNGGALAARAAERQFEAAIDAAAEALREHGANLDITTEAGRQVQETLDSIAVTGMVWADAIYNARVATEGHNKAADAAVEVLRRAREQLVDTAIDAGMTREAAEELANQILGIPEHWEVEFEARAEKAKQTIEELARKINGIKDKTVTITVEQLNRAILFESGLGASKVQRLGGVHYAQQGLVSLGPTAMLFSAGSRPLFGFAEPGTGGEAFIARNAPRDRSLSILDVAARWHKAIVVPMERVAERATHAGPRELLVQIPIQIGDEVVRVVDARIDLHDSKLNDLLVMRTGAAR